MSDEFGRRESNENITARFDRLENKIDKLSETVVILARVEAQLANDRDKIKVLENKVEILEEKNSQTQVTVGALVKGFWVSATVGLAALLGWFLK